MRHNRKTKYLGRTAPHRKAMLSNMSASLIEHKRIYTTVPKAKALRMYIEPIITTAKDDTVHARRMVFRKLQNRDAVVELFDVIIPKVGDRPGGYTRILKTGARQGDNAEMCFIELVDFNEDYTQQKKQRGGKRTRRTRRGGGQGKRTEEQVAQHEAAEEDTEE